MRKLNKLFAMLVAMLGVGTLSAQTWTAPVVGVSLSDIDSNTELYLYNVKADAFACSGMSWGTHAIVKELQNGDSKLSADVHRCRVSKPADGQVQIMLNEKSFLGGGGATSTNDCWVDHASNNVYIYNEVSSNVYTLKPTTATDESYLDCSWAYGGHVTFSGTNGYGNTEWAFVLRSDITSGKYLLYKAKKEMYDIYEALVAAGHEETYADALATANEAYVATDATATSVNAATKILLTAVAPVLSSKYFAANSLFNNPDMRGYGDDTDWGNGLNAFGDGIFESWHSSETVTQMQTGLPNGFYTVVFLGMYRQDGSDAAPTLTLTSGSNSSQANLKALTEIDFGSCSGGNKWTGANKPDDKYSAGEALAHTDAGVKVENFVVENGELTITVAMPSASQWLLCQGFQIYYKAESLEEYANLFYTAKSAAEVIDLETLNDYAADKLSTALSNAATEQVDKKWYQERTAELNEAVALANAVAVPYANVNALITTGESILNNSDELEEGAKEAFTTVVNTVKANVESATTAEAINTEYSTLETARLAYIQKADPTNGTFFDYTFKITNPGFDNGTNGWACESGAQNKGIATNKTNGIITGAFFENWNGSAFTGSISQSVAGLPSGIYTFKAAAFGAGAYVFANDGQTAVTTADGAWYEVEVGVTDGNLIFGLKNENAINWMGIDNASLYFYGFDAATAQAGVTSLKSQAEALVAKPMGATVLAALNDAIANADATKTTRNELEAMTAALNTAIADANASIADYEKILAYITKANGIDASIAADYQAQYENRAVAETAEVVFQKLEVATYNYVMSNFTYPVALSDTWNSTGTNTEAATFNNEHWSGTTSDYKNQKDGTGMGWQASAWTIDFDQEVTLPAGKYVFKVAGRKSADATLSLVVTQGETTLGTVNDFPSSNNSVGINKAGATSFDANDAAGFANNGNGFGWQWRYVMFVLDAEATVKVAVHAETNVVHQWVSFGDYTLQMTEETYLEANKGGVEAAEAAAQALVDTTPMGDAENAALQEALDMTYTTGAEMLAKIEALETAVANANAWVTAYNEAKAPLVAALERFEADYNDGENGAKDHMAKSRWVTVLAMVQAAAEAKDVTNSYEGFAAATENLVDALDAATVSVNEYAALDEAIKAATALANGINWGDEPFQRPESAKAGLNTESAQAVYDAAEAEGEDLATVAEALNAAMDITLNVPEGVFYLNVASEGHTLLGKSVVATLGATGDNNPTGYGLSAATATANYGPKAFTFEQVEGNLYRISVLVNGETVYLTYGSLNGSAAGWATSQIQGTTDSEKAGIFKIEASPAVEGAFRIYNTVANDYIDCQNGGSLYTDDGIQSEDFAIADASTVSVDINITADNKWSTCVLLFDVAELPEGLRAFKSSELAEGSQSLVLEEVTAMEAYTPYILYAQEGYQGTLTGTVDLTDYVAVASDGIALKGAVEQQTITEGYILQNQGSGMKFHKILDSTEFTIPVGKCWLEVNSLDVAVQSVSLKFKEGTTGIEGVALDVEVLNEADGIYTIDGKRVSDMQKGQIYVVGGKKTINR